MLSYIDEWKYLNGQDFVCDFDEYVAQNRTITFDSTGGDDVASITQPTDSSLNALPVPEKEGYYFVGWFTEQVPTSFDSQFTLETMPGKNITLYAGWASEEIKGKFTYEINGEEITVTGYKDGSEIVIPENLFGFTVTEIGDSAFRNCNSIVSVSIPDSVINIGQYAFRDCNSLTIYCEVASLPSDWNSNWNYSNCPVVWDCKNTDVASDGNKNDIYNVTSIGSSAFSGCSSLTSITIPDSVTSINSYAFNNCISLTIYCEVASKPSDWNSNWNSSCPVVWNCKNNDIANDGNIYYIDENGIRYTLKDGNATVVRQSESLKTIYIT